MGCECSRPEKLGENDPALIGPIITDQQWNSLAEILGSHYEKIEF